MNHAPREQITLAEKHLQSEPDEIQRCPKCKEGEPEEIEVCAECGEAELKKIGIDDESWTVCNACRAIEGGHKKALYCDYCVSTI